MRETICCAKEGSHHGRPNAKRIDDGRFRYAERLKGTFPHGMRLDGIKVVIDCANGAAYRTAPEVLWELGAEVIPIGVEPNGYNINQNVVRMWQSFQASSNF